MSNWVAITGGCGYVGSHIAASIKQNTDYKTLLIDNRAELLPHTHQYGDAVVNTDYISGESFNAITAVNPIAIVHCAASSLVGPSQTDPARYYNENVVKLVSFLNFMKNNNFNNLVFSSSSSVYGDGDGISPFVENDTYRPMSVYGKTKMMGEIALNDYYTAYGIRSVSFRYFNAVGAAESGSIGQEPGATHLVAKIMESILSGTCLEIYGDDWPTHDKTCVRDYVHVSDIADAHVKGIEWLTRNNGAYVYNIGRSQGTSVREVINTVERVIGCTVNTTVTKRRVGDPAWLVANVSKIRQDLGWTASRDLEQIVADAYRWYTSNTFKNLKR